jgi:hypothetical protein
VVRYGYRTQLGTTSEPPTSCQSFMEFRQPHLHDLRQMSAKPENSELTGQIGEHGCCANSCFHCFARTPVTTLFGSGSAASCAIFGVRYARKAPELNSSALLNFFGFSYDERWAGRLSAVSPTMTSEPARPDSTRAT